jgi:hypothetical protein
VTLNLIKVGAAQVVAALTADEFAAVAAEPRGTVGAEDAVVFFYRADNFLLRWGILR